MSHRATHQNNEWQSHPITFKDPPKMTESDFPSLHDSAMSSKTNRRNRQLATLAQPQPVPSPSAWSVPEWADDDVVEGNTEVVYSIVEEEQEKEEDELKLVIRKYTDRATLNSRLRCDGYADIVDKLKEKMGSTCNDDSANYRSLILSNPVREYNGEVLIAPYERSMPDWKSKLPDKLLNDEFRMLCELRVVPISLGPMKIGRLRKACEYKSLTKRTLPKYKNSTPIRQSMESPKESLSNQSTFNVVEDSTRNDDIEPRLSLSSHSISSSSTHHIYPSSYRKPITSSRLHEFFNSNFDERSNKRKEHENEHRSDEIDENKPRKSKNSNWEEYEESNYRRRDYGSTNGDYRSGNHDRGWRGDRYENDYDRSENSRCGSDYDRREGSRHYEDSEWDERSERNDRCESDYAGKDRSRVFREYSHYEKRNNFVQYYETHGNRNSKNNGCEKEEIYEASNDIEFVATPFSKKTPAWRETEWKWNEKTNRRTNQWKARWSREQFVLREEKEMSEDERKKIERDSRVYVKDVNVPMDVRIGMRCLDGIIANSSVALADEMGRIELSTWAAENDGEEVKEKVNEKYGLEKIEKEINEETVQLALPKTQITLLFSAGAKAEILFEGECNEVLVMGRNWGELEKAKMEGIVKNREYNSFYVGKKNTYGTPSLSRETGTILTFDSALHAVDAIDDLHVLKIDSEKIPRTLVTGSWDGSYAKRECILELEWERKAVHGFLVHLPNLEKEENQIDRVMRYASHHFTNVTSRIQAYNRMYVPLPWSPYSTEDDRQFLRQVLFENGISVGDIDILRVSEKKTQAIDNAKKKSDCTRAINRRILKIAIDEGVWAGFHPSSPIEWDMMLDEGRFSWMVSMPSDREMQKAVMNYATITFDSFEQGEAISRRMQRMSPCRSGENGFLLNMDDRKGVFARAKLRVHYYVPVFVRSLTIDRLRWMDNRWRENSHFTHAEMATDDEEFNQWACLISDDDSASPPGYCRLIVEGFPSSMVDDCCAELMKVIKGDIVNCEGEEEWLLTGIGRNMADVVAQNVLKELNVMVDFNVIGKEIRLFGERGNTEYVERRLKEMTRKRLTHVIRTRVTIGQPVYLNRTCQAIAACGGLPMVQKVVGECFIKLCPDDVDKRTIIFEGTVAAFDRFKNFLADLDDLLRDSANTEHEKRRMNDPGLKDPSLSPLTCAPLCPICYCRPSYEFYRLEACGHVYCIHCIYHQLSSELGARTFPLVCRRENCGCPIAVSDLLHLLIGDTKGFRLNHMDEIKLRPLVNAVVAHLLQTKRDRLVPCRTADCVGIFARTNNIVRCKTCTKPTCGKCGYEPHRGYNCEDYGHIRENVDASLATYVKTTKKNVRKCPNGACSAVIEKSIGCNHMECVICRTHFCWLCGYSSLTQGDIYSHMQETHGGNGLHMDDGEMFMLQFDD